jgi:hypothetical protein
LHLCELIGAKVRPVVYEEENDKAIKSNLDPKKYSTDKGNFLQTIHLIQIVTLQQLLMVKYLVSNNFRRSRLIMV